MKSKIWLLSAILPGLFAACIQEFTVANSPCPCAEGYECCDHTTGENVCVRKGHPCPCEEVVCIDSPPPGCLDGQVLRYYRTPGKCHLGKCSYDPSDVTCANGCRDNACLPEPCSSSISWIVQVPGAPDTGTVRGTDTTLLQDESSLTVGNFSPTATFGLGEPNETTLHANTNAGSLFVAKHNQDGTLVWATQASGLGTSIRARAVSATEDGSGYVVGEFDNSAIFGEGEPNQTTLTCDLDQDVFTARYNADGTLAWAKQSAGAGFEYINDIAAFDDGSTVVTGSFNHTATFGRGEANEKTLTTIGQDDVFVARYNPDGTLAWARSAGGSAGDFGNAVAALPDGSSVVSGIFGGWEGEPATFGAGEQNETTLVPERGADDSGTDIFIARYDPEGSLVWAKRAGGPHNDAGWDISPLKDESFLIAGNFAVRSTFGPGEPNEITLQEEDDVDQFVARYNPDGTIFWAIKIGPGINEFGGMSSFPDGSFIITGSFGESVTFGPGEPNETTLTPPGTDTSGHFIAQYDSWGGFEWVVESGGLGQGVSTNESGQIMVAGWFTDSAIFDPGGPNETTLNASGQNDIFLLRSECSCIVEPKPVAVLGRIWVMPNPILYETIPWLEENESWITVTNIGSEDVTIDKIYLVGDPDFWFPTEHRDFEFSEKSPDFPFPHRIQAEEDGWGQSLMGFAMYHKIITSRTPETYLVIKTSDPTSPTLRIPIVRYAGYSGSQGGMEGIWLQIKPNPIRLDQISPGNSHVVEIGVMGGSFAGEDHIKNMEFSTTGNDFSILEITDNWGNQLTMPFDIAVHAEPIRVFVEYRPRDNQPENGLLVVTYTDGWGLTQNLRVPILVGQVTPEVRSVFLLFEEDFLDLETGRFESNIPYFPDFPEWDVKVSYNALRPVHSVVIQNQESGTEIAHLEGYSFESVTAADVSSAVFTDDLIDVPFGSNRVILVNTAAGKTYKLGNPVEGEFGLKFNYSPLF